MGCFIFLYCYARYVPIDVEWRCTLARFGCQDSATLLGDKRDVQRHRNYCVVRKRWRRQAIPNAFFVAHHLHRPLYPMLVFIAKYLLASFLVGRLKRFGEIRPSCGMIVFG